VPRPPAGLPLVYNLPGLSLPRLIRCMNPAAALLIGSLLLVSSVAPRWSDPPLEGARLDVDDRFARIDSLESALDDADAAQSIEIQVRLAELYLSTDLPKHRRIALDYLDEVLESEPGHFDAGSLRVRVADSMRYGRQARQWLESLSQEHVDDPRPFSLLGRHHFTEARLRIQRSKLIKARAAFFQSVQIDPSFYEGWHGLAVAELGLERWDGCLVAAERLVDVPEYRAQAHFLCGAALAALGDRERSSEMFRIALEASDPALYDAFVAAQGILDEHSLEEAVQRGRDVDRVIQVMREEEPGWMPGDDLDVGRLLEEPDIRRAAVDTFWRQRNNWPTHLINSRRLQFWRRLVEADVLFGSSGLRGWQTPPGEAIARWGRPDFTIYQPPARSIDVQHWYARGVRLPPREDFPADEQMWVWTYRRDGRWFSLLFTDATLQSNWRATSETSIDMVARSRSEAIVFFDGENQPEFNYALTNTLYDRRNYTHLETSLSVWTDEPWAPHPRILPASTNPRPIPSYLTVEWALYDDTGRRIEYVRRELDEAHFVSSLREQMNSVRSAPGRESLVCRMGAALTPGIYDLAIDLSSPSLGHRTSRSVVVIPGLNPPGLLSLSPLQLAEVFKPYVPSMKIPDEFVRYAYAVLPKPDRAFPRSSRELFVYFEAYNLATDETGRTRFNASYEVYAVDGPPEFDLEGEIADPSMLEGLRSHGVTFVEERSGLSPDGHVVKGAGVDIAELDPGDYLLLVQIEDLHTDQAARRYIHFRKLGDG